MIRSHSDWMTRTNNGMLSRRSPELKAVDKAVQTYFNRNMTANKMLLKQTFQRWKDSKTRQSKDWRNSDRNRRGAVTELDKHLNDGVDQGALGAVRDELAGQVKAVQQEFFSKQVTWKNEFRGKLNSNLVKPYSRDFALYLPVKQYAAAGSDNKFGLAGNTAMLGVNSATLLKSFLSGVVPVDKQAEVLMEVVRLCPNFMSEWAVAAAPFTGIITSATLTAWNAKNVAVSSYRVDKAKVNLQQSVAGKTGTAAIQSLILALERYRNADIYSLGVSGAELGGKIATLAVDGGVATNTAISMTANILKLVNIARIVYNDIQEKTKANAALRRPIDLKIFDTIPIIGCYWLSIAPKSVMLSGIFDEKFGNANWQDDAYIAHTALPKLREAARTVIRMHRFEILGLRDLSIGASKLDESKLAEMRANLDPSRITGFGSNG